MTRYSARAVLFFLIAAAPLACGPQRSNGDDDDDDDDGENWTLEVINNSSATFDRLLQRPCPSEDPDDWNEAPTPAGGIAPGASHGISLPTPGCYALTAEDTVSVCFIEGTTGTLELGEQVTWTIEDSDLTCGG